MKPFYAKNFLIYGNVTSSVLFSYAVFKRVAINPLILLKTLAIMLNFTAQKLITHKLCSLIYWAVPFLNSHLLHTFYRQYYGSEAQNINVAFYREDWYTLLEQSAFWLFY